jgi:hypothetical protein
MVAFSQSFAAGWVYSLRQSNPEWSLVTIGPSIQAGMVLAFFRHRPFDKRGVCYSRASRQRPAHLAALWSAHQSLKQSHLSWRTPKVRISGKLIARSTLQFQSKIGILIFSVELFRLKVREG